MQNSICLNFSEAQKILAVCIFFMSQLNTDSLKPQLQGFHVLYILQSIYTIYISPQHSYFNSIKHSFSPHFKCPFSILS